VVACSKPSGFSPLGSAVAHGGNPQTLADSLTLLASPLLPKGEASAKGEDRAALPLRVYVKKVDFDKEF